MVTCGKRLRSFALAIDKKDFIGNLEKQKNSGDAAF
jgi:hypothetical protein